MKSQMFVVFVGFLLIACSSPGPIGGNTDAHGCLVGAGYSWDADIGACTRAWEITGDLAKVAKTAVASLSSDRVVVVKVEPLRCPGCYEVQVKMDGTPYSINVNGETASSPEEIVCGECPKYSPPGPGFCTNGEIVSGPVDVCGCQGPPACACTEEAKVCPDGSAVGRDPKNNCEFRPCDVEMQNPASKFCESQGGTVKMVPREGGIQGICVLPDGAECDEWEYFRGECPGGHVCTDEEKAAEACTMEYDPVCGNDGVTYGNPCSACASGTIDSWTPGECASP